MQWKISEVPEEWPGKAAGTTLFLAYPTSDDACVGVLVRYLRPDHPIAISINADVNELVAQFKPVTLDSPERRGYVAGRSQLGGIMITEYAID